MEKIPEAEVKVQTIEAVRLPSSSYKMRNHRYARFQPFEVWDDNDNNGNNQLNWTNLFLLNKLGRRTLTSADIDAITQISNLNVSDESTLKEVKALARKMSNECAEIKDKILGIRTGADFEKLRESISDVIKESDMGARIAIVEAKVDRIDKMLAKLSKHLGLLY